jgi:hypothetical protein
MNVERYIRLVAGVFVMASLALGYWVHPGWFLFTAFVGLNLFQSAQVGGSILIRGQATQSAISGAMRGILGIFPKNYVAQK